MKAIILAAGQGSRLKPKTDNLPKCLVQVKNVPILNYQLEALNRLGITECVIVVGFMGDLIRQEAGDKFGDLHISYVDNKYFIETNNIYSLWCAKEYLADDIILIEGDVLFDRNILSALVDKIPSNTAVIDDFRSDMDGTVIIRKSDFASSMILKSQQGKDFDYSNAFKTVNIYSFDGSTMQQYLIPALDTWVDEGFTNEFYEAAIADLIAHNSIELETQHVGKNKWVEIDTIDDLEKAESAINYFS